MASREQGTYDDEVRVFDGAEEEGDEEGSRLPLLIVIALLVLSAFGGVVWLAYERGVANGRGEPRLLTADAGPVKVAPANPGGTDTPYKGLKIYEQQAPSDEESDRAPPPPNANRMAAAPPATPTTAMSPVLRPPLESTAPKSPDKVATIDTAPERTAPPSPPDAVPSHKATVTQTEPDVVPVARLATRSPAALTQTEPATTTSPGSDAVPAQHAATGAYVLQIGSYKSPDEANDSWESFKARHAALLSGRSEDVKRVDLGDKGIWYRLRLISFADKATANALCDRLKADGGNCFLSK